MEVSGVLIIATADLDLTVKHLGALEQVERSHVDGLLEVDIVLLAQTAGLDLGLALYSQLEGLVVDEPDVVVDEGVHIGDSDILGHVDVLVLVGGGVREVDGGEGRVRLEVLEVEVALEAVDLGVDGAVGGDGRVDLHRVRVRGRVEDVDALDLQLGVVHLGLRDLGHAHEDADTDVSDAALRNRAVKDLH